MRFTLLLLMALGALAQDGEKATFNPKGPKTLVVSVFRGDIAVKAHAGKDVVVEVHRPRSTPTRREPPPGMSSIGTGNRLNVKQSGNEIRVYLLPSDQGDLTIEVPADTSLRLDTATRGEINVEGVIGDIEANNMHGGIHLSNISGAIKAFSMSGNVTVSMSHVPNKAMICSTFRGKVDVTLPANSKADLSIKSSPGNIFNDFDIVLKGAPTPQGTRDEDTREVRFDRTVVGTMNGGGPEIQFTTFNGAVYVRKI